MAVHEQVIMDYDNVAHYNNDSITYLKPGMVVVTSGSRHSLISKAIAWATGSWWTHAFIVTGTTTAVEAFNPRVREIEIGERMIELEKNGQSYIVLDLPNITDEQREKVAAVAKSFIGRSYNNLQTILFGLFRVFWKARASEPFCSTLVTKVFQSALNLHIFTERSGNELIARFYYRWHNLVEGLVTPVELVQFSALHIVGTDVVL
jgi:hypothetical protein